MDQRLPGEGESGADRHNRRVGLALFAVYFVIYAVFVVMVYRDYAATGRVVAGGLNVAIVYGMGLILSAFVISLIYMALARKN